SFWRNCANGLRARGCSIPLPEVLSEAINGPSRTAARGKLNFVRAHVDLTDLMHATRACRTVCIVVISISFELVGPVSTQSSVQSALDPAAALACRLRLNTGSGAVHSCG